MISAEDNAKPSFDSLRLSPTDLIESRPRERRDVSALIKLGSTRRNCAERAQIFAMLPSSASETSMTSSEGTLPIVREAGTGRAALDNAWPQSLDSAIRTAASSRSSRIVFTRSGEMSADVKAACTTALSCS